MKKSITRAVSFTATDTVYLSLPDSGDLTWRLINLKILSDDDVATHGSNHYTLAFSGSDGSTAIGSWTSNSSGGAALTAGQSYPITIASSLGGAGEVDASSNQSIKLVATKAGSAADFSGMILAEFEAVS